MNKRICLIVTILLCITSYSFADGCKIIVKDFRNKPVQFILKPQEKVDGEKLLKSDKKGILEISDEDYQKYKESMFRLEFVNKLAELIYDKRLNRKQQESEENQLAQEGYYVLGDLCKGPSEFIVPNLKRGLKPKH